MTTIHNDGLALEYQGDYGTAFGDVNISDLVNNPSANGVCRVFGLSLSEETTDLLGFQIRPLLHDSGDSLLIGKYAPQPLA